MNLNDLRKRVERLDELSPGLAKEIVVWKSSNDLLLYRERQDYLKAIREAWAGVEAAAERADPQTGNVGNDRLCQ